MITFIDFHLLDHYIEFFNDHSDMPVISVHIRDKKILFTYRFYDGKQYQMIGPDRESFCERFTKGVLVMTDDEIVNMRINYDTDIQHDPLRFYSEIIVTLSMSL